MSSELYEALTERFVKGIRKTFTPCPLIGPKWLQEFPKGRPADFRFFGMRKLAKATGRPIDKVLPMVMRNVSFEGLGVDWEIKQGCLIDINRKGKAPLPPKKQPNRQRSPQSLPSETPPAKPAVSDQQVQKRRAFRQSRKNMAQHS